MIIIKTLWSVNIKEENMFQKEINNTKQNFR